MDTLTLQQAERIAAAIVWRQDNWESEHIRQSIIVVLLNHGNQFTKVECTHGEWSGVKSDLEDTGVPRCPSGHPLYELDGGKRLALVDNLSMREEHPQ